MPHPTLFAQLRRYPRRDRELLQAWDAADELIIEHLSTLDLKSARIAILNDSFGALTVGTVERASLTSYTDSYLSARAIELNSNGAAHAVHQLADLTGPFDLAVLRVPKNLAFLADELHRLSHVLKPGAPLIAGYMLKHQANGAFDLINRIIGATTTSLARKKARLIFAQLEKPPTPSPYPQSVTLDGFDTPFSHPSLLFSREKLDIGTRFLLEHLPGPDDFPATAPPTRILDLGCGNGIIGITAQRAFPDARIIFSDESALAVESARANYAAHATSGGAPCPPPEFHWTHAFATGEAESLDLVLCNPPFHQGATVGDQVAREMFRDAHRALRPGGLLRVIGNSHLHYPAILARIFDPAGDERVSDAPRVRIVAKNPKFTIVDALRQARPSPTPNWPTKAAPGGCPTADPR